MENNSSELRSEALLAENRLLQNEVDRLRTLLSEHGIDESRPDAVAASTDEQNSGNNISLPLIENDGSQLYVTKRSSSDERIALFKLLFCGRDDVYAKRWVNSEGKAGYSPVCRNEWKRGICQKPRRKCAKCSHTDYTPYDESAIAQHLSGNHVLGIYPLQTDNTCRFLAIDFDKDEWQKEVSAVVGTCKEKGVPYAIEISRSGNGAHLWFFFDVPIQASQARSFGSTLLSESMKSHARLSFASYDRLFPNQDIMPNGGFGNLIALPFQKEAYRNGGSIFVDDGLKPYQDQWVFLSSISKITRERIENWTAQWETTPLGELRKDDDEECKPWQRQDKALSADDVPAVVKCVMADRLYIPETGFSQRAQNRLKRLSAFRNPAFYKAQAMRMPIWNIPRVICCAEYQDHYLCLPRGCRDEVMDFANGNSINIEWDDLRNQGNQIDVSFCGTLRDEQQAALQALSSHDEGVLSATTAFGKTVVGAALIAEKRVNTLILVHRKQLMKQWQERLHEFLDVAETLPEIPKKKGRKKKREIIGLFGAGKDTRSGILDIAILQSMGRAEDIKPWVMEYGMVIVDECHHVPAVSFEQVLKVVRAKYLYGLTATPTRQDGHHPILNMYLGPIRYRGDAKAQAEKRPFEHVMIPRFTGTRFHINTELTSPPIIQYYSQIMEDDIRNHQIVDDIVACANEGRSCLVLSERKQHVALLAALLRGHISNVLIMTGGKSNVETEKQFAALNAVPNDQPLVICATGRYIGEGFDESRLDTLFLTMPIAWHGTLTQYAGRLHRLYEGKREVRVYDYIDTDAEMMERMYHKRLRGYAAIDYHVATDEQATVVSSEIIYNQATFQERFLDDLQSAKRNAIIVCPYVSVRRVRWLERVFRSLAGNNIRVAVHTRPASSFQGKNATVAQTAISMLEAMGVHVFCKENIYQKYAIIDDAIVWYGSINLLSFGASQESIIRLLSGTVARALSPLQNHSLLRTRNAT